MKRQKVSQPLQRRPTRFKLTVFAFTRISDAFIKRFLMHEGETLEEAKARIAREEAALLQEKQEHKP